MSDQHLTYRPFTSETGAPYVMWVLANSPKPLTAEEVATELDANRNAVSATLGRLFRSELLVRRTRSGDGRGNWAYEYAIMADDLVTIDA